MLAIIWVYKQASKSLQKTFKKEFWSTSTGGGGGGLVGSTSLPPRSSLDQCWIEPERKRDSPHREPCIMQSLYWEASQTQPLSNVTTIPICFLDSWWSFLMDEEWKLVIFVHIWTILRLNEPIFLWNFPIAYYPPMLTSLAMSKAQSISRRGRDFWKEARPS